MSSRTGFYLLAAGVVGVLSLLLVPFEKIAPDTGLPPLLLRSLSILQPAILTVGLVLVGNALAPRVGLGAPVVGAWATGESALPALRRLIGPAALGAAAVAVLLTGYSAMVVPRIIEQSQSEAFARLVAHGPPLVTKLLYGGITEELITRWGLVSLFAWLAWRLLGKPAPVPRRVFWSAITLAALLFAGGHLPLLFALVPDPAAWIVFAVVIGNAVPGIIFGWLFWKHGIEAAMIAHGGAHLLASAALAL